MSKLEDKDLELLSSGASSISSVASNIQEVTADLVPASPAKNDQKAKLPSIKYYTAAVVVICSCLSLMFLSDSFKELLILDSYVLQTGTDFVKLLCQISPIRNSYFRDNSLTIYQIQIYLGWFLILTLINAALPIISANKQSYIGSISVNEDDVGQDKSSIHDDLDLLMRIEHFERQKLHRYIYQSTVMPLITVAMLVYFLFSYSDEPFGEYPFPRSFSCATNQTFLSQSIILERIKDPNALPSRFQPDRSSSSDQEIVFRDFLLNEDQQVEIPVYVKLYSLRNILFILILVANILIFLIILLVASLQKQAIREKLTKKINDLKEKFDKM